MLDEQTIYPPGLYYINGLRFELKIFEIQNAKSLM